MTLTRLRIKHEKWTITKQADGKLHCQHGAFRFTAKTPDAADEGIILRETPTRSREQVAEPDEGVTFGQFSDEMAKPGF